MNLHFTKNKLSGKPSPRKGLAHMFIRDPYIDWAIILAITTVAVIIFVSVGICSFVNFNDDAGTAAGTVTAGSVDTNSLKKVLKEFDNRSLKRADLIRGYAGPGDPSL